MNQKNISFLIIGFLVFAINTFAQNGAYQTFKFLSVNPSAKIAAIGGTQVSQLDNDASIILQNPALLNHTMHNQLSTSYVNYLSDASFGLINYAQQKKFGTVAASVLYFNGGNFTQTDETATITGKFKVNEAAFILSYANKIDSVLSIGISTKYIFSALETYRSQGLAFDFGGTYTHPNQSFSAGFVVKNLGFQTKKYTSESANLPLDIQAGIAYKLEHVPFRVSLTAIQLNRPKLVYVDTINGQTIDPITNSPVVPKKQIGANIANHFVIGGELVLSKAFQIRLGYNFKRRYELKVDDAPGITGFSFGFGIKLSKWQLNYGFSRYHAYGNSNHITLNFNIDNFAKKKV